MDDNANLENDLANIDQNSFDDFLLELGDDDDMIQLEDCPSSPVLCASYRRSSRLVVDDACLEDPSTSNKAPSDPSKYTPSPLYSSERQLTAKSATNRGKKADASNFSNDRVVTTCETRSVQVRERSRKQPTKRSGEPISNPSNQKSVRKARGGGTGEAACEQQQRQDKDMAPQSSQQGVETDCNDDSDLISIYARDEDCLSLYQSSSGVVEKRRQWKAPKTGKKQPLNGKTRPRKPIFSKPADLRKHIRKKTRTFPPKFTVSGLHNLLSCNRRQETLVAADKFCKMYAGNNFKNVDRRLYNFTRNLAEMLLRYREIKYLYRIVRLSIDMQVIVSENVICGLVQHLRNDNEYGKINIILRQIREKSLEFGDRVQSLVVRYLGTGRPVGTNQEEDGNMMSESLRVVRSCGENDTYNASLGCSRSFLTNSDPVRNRGIVSTVSSRSSDSTLVKDSLYVHVPNNNNLRVARTASFGCIPQSDINPRRVIKNDEGSDECDSSYYIDSGELGKCITRLLGAIGGQQIETSLYTALAELVINNKLKSARNGDDNQAISEMKLFLHSSISCASDKERTMAHLSWICTEAVKQLPSKTAYKAAYLMRDSGLQIVPPVMENSPSQLCKKARFFSASAVVDNCLEYNDLDLGLHVIDEYFDKVAVEFGPMLSPLICKMLCKVAELAYANKRYMDAARCFGMYPAGFGDGMEGYIMQDVLLGILTDTHLITKEEADICNTMVDQMLARRMVNEVRAIIVKAFCANVVCVFKFLEGKGVYRRPQIACYPHLIIIPCLLCVEEMALMIQRHLTELAEFLAETGERIRTHIPMRIVLSKDTGSLRPIPPIDRTRSTYEDSLARLTETITHLLNPNLKIDTKELKREKQEYLINVDIHSVRLWMLTNTSYYE